MKNVTYQGPENENEVSDYLVVGGLILPLGKEVQVPDDVAKAAQEFEGHKVSVSAGKKDDDVPDAQPSAINPDPEDEAPVAAPAEPAPAAPGA